MMAAKYQRNRLCHQTLREAWGLTAPLVAQAVPLVARVPERLAVPLVAHVLSIAIETYGGHTIGLAAEVRVCFAV